MTCQTCNANFQMQAEQQRAWQIRDPFYGIGYGAAIGAPVNVAQSRSKPKDLTPRQIEWCRANISSFMPKVINAPR